jgi:hypothetical protein
MLAVSIALHASRFDGRAEQHGHRRPIGDTDDAKAKPMLLFGAPVGVTT